MGNETTVAALIDIYDDEFPRLESVISKLNSSFGGKHVDMEAARREVIERFQDAGFVVNVKVYSAMDAGGMPIPDLYPFDIEIIGRTERLGEFDFERQQFNVVNDILGLKDAPVGETRKFDPSELHVPGGHHH